MMNEETNKLGNELINDVAVLAPRGAQPLTGSGRMARSAPLGDSVSLSYSIRKVEC